MLKRFFEFDPNFTLDCTILTSLSLLLSALSCPQLLLMMFYFYFRNLYGVHPTWKKMGILMVYFY